MKAKLLRITLAATLSISLLMLVFTACQKGSDGPGPSGEEPVNDDLKYTASVRGIVIDEHNQPVTGAAVSSGTAHTLTDNNGVFRFNNIQLSATNGNVKVEKLGYFNASRSFKTVSGRTHNVRIKLLPKTNSGNFTGATGGTVSLGGGGKLIIPAGAVADASGNSYSGAVNVAMTWIDPTSADLPVVIPGDLRGISTTGIERGLQTFGMLGVELVGGAGQPLNIAAGKKAELTFPIPAALQATAPATIDLWHFDEASARWKQEGTATKTGNNYIGEVSHFSFWNCDAPFPLINICMQVVKSQTNEPLNNVPIRIRRVSTNMSAYGYADSLGNLCGAVPRNEALVLEILDQCGNVAYSQNIGPFSDHTDIGTINIVIPPVNTLTITGKLTNCSSVNVTNGAVYINAEGGYSYAVPVINGDFSLSIINCNANTLDFTVTGIDYATSQQGTTVNTSGVSGTVNLGTIQACGASASEFFELNVGGSLLNFLVSADSLMAYSDVDTGAYTLRTSIWAQRRTNSNAVGLVFRNNGVAGTLPVVACYVEAGGAQGSSQNVVSQSPTVTITNFGPVGSGFIQGSFAFDMDFSGATKTVIGTFRVRRGS